VQKDQAPVPPKPSVASSADTQKVLTDRTKKPTYKTTPKTTTTTGDSTKKKSSSKKSSTPKKDTVSQPSKSGQYYDPVFGYSHGTGGQGTKVDGDWGGGSQVGIMD
jgi:hypothetical protein